MPDLISSKLKSVLKTYFIFLLLFFGNTVFGQETFQIIEGVPHLVVVDDPASIQTPEPGMLIYDETANQPLIYTGDNWESWCTGNIAIESAVNYFRVKNDFPYLPVLSQPLINGIVQGTIYYSTVDKSLMIYNGVEWVRLSDLESNAFPENLGFRSGREVETFKIPVLEANPTFSGLRKGAFYINVSSMTLRYFDGTGWQDISCYPIVETLSVDGVTGTSAQGGAVVLNNGGSPVFKTGIIWSTYPIPDTTMGTKTEHHPTAPGIGEFRDSISELAKRTTYYVRAYAVNSTGLAYGDPLSFTTLIDTPSIVTLEIENITPISAESGGYISSDGGAQVTKRGIIWSQQGDPIDDPDRFSSDDGDGVGLYSSTLSNLWGATIYYIRAYAENEAGTGYGQLIEFITNDPVAPELTSNSIHIYNIEADRASGDASLLNHGGAPIFEKGIAWSIDQMNWIFGPSSDGDLKDMGLFSTELSPLEPGTTYYAKGYAINKMDTAYTHTTSFVTPSLPLITTNEPTDITGFNAVSGGEITNTGNSVILKKGIVWSTDSTGLDINTAIVELLPDSQMTVQSHNGVGVGIFKSELSQLQPGTKYYVRAYAENEVGVAYGNLDSLTTLDLATIITLTPSSFFQATAQSGGDITDDGGTEVTQRGVVWARHITPTLNDFHTIDGNGAGLFNSTLTGLSVEITYYVRAYAINAAGIVYGDIREFSIIPGAPTIITLPIQNIKSSSAVSGGDITSAGDQNSPITKRGIRWSSIGDPIDDPNASVSIDDTQDGDGVGMFPSTLYSLRANTTYYVRAYAENKYGMAYGNLLQFTTLNPVPPTLNSADIRITDIDNTSAVAHGSIIDNGGEPIIARGIAISTDRINYTYIQSDSSNLGDLGSFVVNLEELSPATTYYAKTYAVNSVGTGYSSETSFNTTALAVLTTLPAIDIKGNSARSGGHITYNGDGKIEERGLMWNTIKDELSIELESKVVEKVNATGLGQYRSQMTALEPGTWYYFRAFASNSYGIAYGNTDSLFTATTAAIVTTTPSLVTNSTVRSGGTILDDGGQVITSRGVVWGISDSLTLVDEYTVNGFGVGTFISDLKELLGSTTYYVRAYAKNSVGVSYGEPKSFRTDPPGIPVVRTIGVLEVTDNTALGNGNVMSHGGSPIIERGFVWNTTGMPNIDGDQKITDEPGSGAFSATLTGLTPLTKYYFRAYAINAIGIAYGEEFVFTTYTLPTVITSNVIDISATEATGGGDVLSDGGNKVSRSGLVWSHIHTEPTYSYYGNRENTWQTSGGAGIGNFIHPMEGLLGNTTYYVRAYAVNSAGVSYGEVKTFTTNPPVLASLTTTQTTSRADGRSANSGGKIISNGGAVIEQVGVVWGTTSGFNPDNVQPNRYLTSGTGNFSVIIPNLAPGITYYVRALVVTSVGVAYGNEVQLRTFNYPEVITKPIDATTITSVSAKGGGEIRNDGGTEIISSGLVWSTEQKPTLENDRTQNGGGKGEFVNTITELRGNTAYYVRAYAQNGVGVSYGEQIQFTTAPPIPATVVTQNPNLLSATTAKGGGNIISDGGAQVTTRGLIWLKEIDWTIEGDFVIDNVPESNRTAETGYFKGSYTHDIKNLEGDTKYYIRAYVINNVGISYGQVIDFRTPKLPELTTIAAKDISSSMAISGGEITDEGGSPIIARGVVYSTVMDFKPDTISFFKTANGAGEGIYESPLTRLKGNTTYYVRAYAQNIAGLNYGNQISFITDPPQLPTVITREASQIEGTIATSGGHVIDDGGDDIISRGIVWSTQQGFDYKNVPTSNKTVHTGNAIGSFTSGMTGLAPGTTYYVRAYASNDIAGTNYGEEVSFTTLSNPSVKTMAPSILPGGTNTRSGGEILSDGGDRIRNQGVIWSTINDPGVLTTSLSTRTSGDELNGRVFNSTIAKLLPITTYYVRAYATNNQGVGYGDILSFTTPAVPPTITTNVVIPISKTSVTTGGTISTDGGANIIKRGVVWSTDINFNPDTVIINRTEDGIGIGSYSTSIHNLEMSTSYYVRAYASNAAGTGYGNQVAVTIFPTSPVLETLEVTHIGGYTAVSGGEFVSDGGSPITQKGIVWSTEPNPTIRDNRTRNGAEMEGFESKLTNLLPNTKYYVRAYATNKIGTAYGIEVEFLTNGLPVLTVTKSVTDIVATTANSGGEVTDDGRTPILARGITWSTYGNPTISLTTRTIEKIEAPDNGLGDFTAGMARMKPETTYYVRSYATNSVGTEYGAQVSFKTKEVTLPVVTTMAPSEIDSIRAVSGGDVADDGGMPVTVRGVTWSKNPMPTTSELTKTNHVNGGLGVYENVISGLSPGTTYYVRAYAINSVGTAYGQEERLTTNAIRPTVSQVTISDLTMTTAKASASVLHDGGAEITDRGFTWSTQSTAPLYPTHSDSTLSLGAVVDEGDWASIESIFDNLNANTTYYIWAYASNKEGTRYSARSTLFTTLSLPSVTTTKPSSITRNSARSGGNVIHDGGVSVTARGVIWSTDSTLISIDLDTKTLDGVNKGSYTSLIKELDEGTVYYVRAYAINAMGVAYGNLDSLKTLSVPIVVTTPVTEITSESITTGGEITDDGGMPVLSRGVVWSRTEIPTISMPNKTSNGKGIGEFVSEINKLEYFTVYYIRAYATNSLGTAYGQIDTIRTAPIGPKVSNVIVENVSDNEVAGSAIVLDDGGEYVTLRGIVWNTIGQPTLEDNVLKEGEGIGEFMSQITNIKEGPTYHVRAFAINSVDTTYSSMSSRFKRCPAEFTVIHVAGLNGAPEDKMVTYRSVSSDYSGDLMCWITQNLGAETQAASATDNSEAAAGWYWQFNRSQGYRHDGTTRSPSNAWTSWIGGVNGISENKSWSADNDPCNLLLGSGWRMPTQTELTNVDAAPQNWTKAEDAYGSVLKVHMAGALSYTNGALQNRGVSGYYWSTSQSSSNRGHYLSLGSGSSAMANTYKTSAMPIRCLRDTAVVSLPTLSNVTILNKDITEDSALASAVLVSNGGEGEEVSAKGLVWSTKKDPMLDDNVIMNGVEVGDIEGSLEGLLQGPTYYVRAFATNSKGTAYSPMNTAFKVCNPLTIIHTEGLNGAPESKIITYATINSSLSGAPKCWIVQNLGADRPAFSATDGEEEASGWYWQFNRIQGYKHDGTTRTPSNAWTKWTGGVNGISENQNWQEANDPCMNLLGAGWRLPTNAELNAAVAPPQNWTSAAGAYDSELKLHMAGALDHSNGSLTGRGSSGYYWSSNQSSANRGNYLTLSGSSSQVVNAYKTYAMPVRCLQDTIVLALPSVTNVEVPASEMSNTTALAIATVALDGGTKVSTRGFVWNTSGTPTLEDNIVATGSGVGEMQERLQHLIEGSTYYVRAFATNALGTAYSPEVTSFKICNDFTVIHTEGLNGSPESKTITYGTISSNISGAARCWITQNLGAEQQASSVDDSSDEAAGWYWQFNRSQGYTYDGTGYVPRNAWTSWIGGVNGINQSQNWTAANDPCNLLLGSGWRLPTNAEWTAADAPPQNWTSAAGAYDSELKLHMAGVLDHSNGSLTGRGTRGYYWSSSQSSSNRGYHLATATGSSAMGGVYKTYAMSVRCIRDEISLTVPSVTNVSVPTPDMTEDTATGFATVSLDGGAKVSGRGLVYNTSGAPTLDNATVVSLGSDVGDISGLMDNLIEGPTYYVRAFATNALGTAYSPEVTSFKICNDFTVTHIAGENGAPISKTITYGTISSDISGASKCWITQNLGASRQAISTSDASIEAAGWFWQFNRPSGFDYSTAARVPETSWIGGINGISQNSGWTAANDPCLNLLGGGWRLPTNAEWTAADAPPQNWTVAADAFASEVKLHMAGQLDYNTGALTNQGKSGSYWSGTQSSSNRGNYLGISTGSSAMSNTYKTTGFTVRCLQDDI